MLINSENEEINIDSSYVLEDISSTIMHLHSKPNYFDAQTLTDFITAQGEIEICQQAAKLIGQGKT